MESITEKPKFHMDKLKNMVYHVFREGEYGIKVCKLPKDRWGQCSDPKSRKPLIKLSDTIDNEKLLLEVILDEALHASLFCIDNFDIDIISDSLAEFLIKAGFRYVPEMTEPYHAQPVSEVKEPEEQTSDIQSGNTVE